MNTKYVVAGSVASGAGAGIANATAMYTGAVAAANAAGLTGAAAITSALASLGGGAVAAGGGGMAAGVTTLIGAAAWPAAAVAVVSFGGYQLYKRFGKRTSYDVGAIPRSAADRELGVEAAMHQ